MSANTYHDGDLRAAALETGLRLLKGRDDDDLGLRELARDAGVSATALYRHFPNKRALRTALALEAAEALGTFQKSASDAAGGDSAGFAAMGIAYVKYAAENPALFRLMFRQAADIDLLEGDITKVSSAIRGLSETVAGLTPETMSDDKRKASALRAWSLVHGLACLILDGQIKYDPDLIRAVVSTHAVISA
ncbi:MAG: TetR/AcrR family transcriptional regulator [Gammaproteobacteria bacterium]